MPGFAGIRLCQDPEAARLFAGAVHRVELQRKADRLLFERPGLIGDGGNSGFQALNLAAQFLLLGGRPSVRKKRIVLVGFDMRLDRGLHWHGRHDPGLNNPRDASLPRWRNAIDGAASELCRRGIEVLNASPVSTLTAYPFVELRRVL